MCFPNFSAIFPCFLGHVLGHVGRRRGGLEHAQQKGGLATGLRGDFHGPTAEDLTSIFFVGLVEYIGNYVMKRLIHGLVRLLVGLYPVVRFSYQLMDDFSWL